ncbi:MAG: DHH family phosphoesterase [Planifilum sp.]|jgi:c-di-AMP phosphodiesterase-like protein
MPDFIMQRWHGKHMVWAMCFHLVLIAVLASFDWLLGAGGLAIFFLLSFYLFRAERAFRKDFIQYVMTLTDRIKAANQQAIEQMPLGILLYNKDRRIEWHNPFVRGMTEEEELVGKAMNEVFPGLKELEETEEPVRVTVGDRTFEVIHRAEERLFYFREVTRLARIEHRYQQDQVFFGIMHMDNFEEAGQGLTDQNRTLLLSNVTGAITRWAEKHDICLRRLDSDKFFLILRRETLDAVIRSRFEILDEVREMTRHNPIPITLSIGVSTVGQALLERAENAQGALEIALARGGDQAVVQSGERMLFFGGKMVAVEKRTRVRARVISHALGNLIRDSERVLIMGHAKPDMDAMGAAIGVLKAVRLQQRPGYIVLDDENPSIERLMEAVANHDELKDRIVSPERALQLTGPGTLLIMVDTHKPSLTIEPRLVGKVKRVVVIYHHRRGEEFVQDPVLVYLESYASSTSELVTELLQYQGSRISLDTLEATALLAGMVVDTRNFMVRAGSRTFEAASFLRRHGADLTMVQTLLKEDLRQFVKRAEIVKNTEVVYDKIAIAVAEEDERYGQVLIAQAADTLLNMQGVTASFVIGMLEDGRVAISARSQGDLNVQLVMEALGGGGHLTNAAVQLKGVSLTEARERLMETLKQLIEEGGLVE